MALGVATANGLPPDRMPIVTVSKTEVTSSPARPCWPRDRTCPPCRPRNRQRRRLARRNGQRRLRPRPARGSTVFRLLPATRRHRPLQNLPDISAPATPSPAFIPRLRYVRTTIRAGALASAAVLDLLSQLAPGKGRSDTPFTAKRSPPALPKRFSLASGDHNTRSCAYCALTRGGLGSHLARWASFTLTFSILNLESRLINTVALARWKGLGRKPISQANGFQSLRGGVGEAGASH